MTNNPFILFMKRPDLTSLRGAWNYGSQIHLNYEHALKEAPEFAAASTDSVS